MGAGVIHWTGENVLAGQVAVRVGREGEALVAEWPGSARLVVRPGDRPLFETCEGAEPTLVAKLASEIIPALVWHAGGGLSLHASAVVHGDRAVAFVGPPDAGKSTAVADLCARPGFQLLADDALRIDAEGRAHPAGRKAWVDAHAARALGLPSEGTGRSPVPLASSSAPAKLTAVVRLVFADGAVSLRSLRGGEAFRVLVDAAIRIVTDDPRRQIAEFEQLRALFQRISVLELRRPRSYARLPEAAAVLAAVFRSEA